MTRLFLENDAIRVAILPDYGARVVSLVGKGIGRDWIYGGGQSWNIGEDAVYGKEEAVGWDECFPTVSAYQAEATPWRRRLRDHGDLWGRPWQVEAQTASELTTAYTDPQFRFVRTLRVDGPSLIAEYRVENLSAEPLPYLWAQHNLLAVSPGDRIEFAHAARVTASFLSHRGKVVPTPVEFDWPGPDAGLPFPLDVVQPASTDLAGKFLVHGVPDRTVALGRDGGWLTITWDGVDDLGIWLTYGAWFGVYHLALEPQSFFADHLGQASARGASPLPPLGGASWRTVMTVGPTRN